MFTTVVEPTCPRCGSLMIPAGGGMRCVNGCAVLWTEDQVASLRAYQAAGVFHPFTSANGKDLIPTLYGWVEREGGPVVQEWAHSFMLDWSWKALAMEDPFHAARLATMGIK